MNSFVVFQMYRKVAALNRHLLCSLKLLSSFSDLAKLLLMGTKGKTAANERVRAAHDTKKGKKKCSRGGWRAALVSFPLLFYSGRLHLQRVVLGQAFLPFSKAFSVAKGSVRV